MWIVRLALSRPYTFIVMALVIILLTPVVLLRTPTDWAPIWHSLWVCSLYAVPSLIAAYLVFLRRDVAGG